MSATYSTAQQARQVLADRLRELRIDAGLTGPAHAQLCGWHKAKTSRIENNKSAPSATDITTWCHICGADEEAADLVASLRTVEGMYVEWRRMHRDGLRPGRYDAALQQSRRFRCYGSWAIPGLLQTPAYTEQVLRIVQRRHGLNDDTGTAVAARLERQQLLTDSRRRFAFCIEEHVLRSDTATPDVMTEQMRHLSEMAARPNVSIGIIPMHLGRKQWQVESFWIVDDTYVNVELVAGFLTVTQPREIAIYAETFARLGDLAVTGADARALLTTAINVG